MTSAAGGILLGHRRAERLDVAAQLRMLLAQAAHRRAGVHFEGGEHGLLLEGHVLREALAQRGELAAVFRPAPGAPGRDHGVERAIDLQVLGVERAVGFHERKFAARGRRALDVGQALRPAACVAAASSATAAAACSSAANGEYS